MIFSMTRKHPFALLTAWVALAAASATWTRSADDASRSTTVTGRVQNVETGRYLNNAKVSVRGSDVVVSTDESGTYRLSALPPGPIRLRVFYTGLEPHEIALDLAAGQTVERNVDLRRVGARTADGAVKLDALVVSSGRETDGEAIAINEQRFAPNIKNVVSADALGDVTDGNVGEFLKFLPGVTAEYDGESGSSVASVAVRGFPTSMAVVSGDGMQMANTGNPTGSSRVFQFTQVSMNNITRLEVTKVPTSDVPASSLGGSINIIKTIRNRMRLPRNSYLANAKPAVELVNSVSTVVPIVMKTVFWKKRVNGCLLHASAKLPHCGFCGSSTIGHWKTSRDVFSAVTNIQMNGNSVISASTISVT